MRKNIVLIFFSLLFTACDSYLTSDSLLTKRTDAFAFKITPGKAKTASSTMPTVLGPMRGPTIVSANVENSLSKNLIPCRKKLLNQQVHFIVNF